MPVLEDALADGATVLPPVVVAELLSGARTARDRRAVADLLADLALHETPREHWARVGVLRGTLRARGLTVSVVDAHVAQCALDLGGVLVTRDRVFEAIAKLSPLRVTNG